MSAPGNVFSLERPSPIHVLVLYYGAPHPVWVTPMVAAAVIGSGHAVEVKEPEAE